tara:strand:+ start:4359 stop:4823 length:465 start_codon:yes stop_codon:yes gene_type:complete
MKKYIFLFLIIFSHNKVFAHCQIPCGIYDDAVRIIQIKEDFQTIKKAMLKINELANTPNPLSLNQLNRWIIAKEDHATNIQKTISEYFLTQRIKDTHQNYIEHTTILQKLLVIAMKCKQTLEQDNVNNGLNLITSFSEIYFDSHGLKHLDRLEN